MCEERKKLLEIKHLKKYFPIPRKITEVLSKKPQKSVKAVDDITLDIYEDEILALVGESGCGKSSFARTIIRLYDPDSGQIIMDGKDITKMSKKELRPLKRNSQMVFQDPYSSLNPRMMVGDMLKEEFLYHHICEPSEVDGKIKDILEKVGLSDDAIDRFPSEFSGGQRQRIGIARALAVNPKFLVTDEPVSALDISIQAQILNLLKELQKEYSLTILFISHNLNVVYYIADRVAVMYLGKIVELGDTKDIYSKPLHPYTDILIRSSPNLDPRKREEAPAINGNPPSPIDIPPGCRFAQRCPFAKDICHKELPELKEIYPGHMCACHRYNSINN